MRHLPLNLPLSDLVRLACCTVEELHLLLMIPSHWHDRETRGSDHALHCGSVVKLRILNPVIRSLIHGLLVHAVCLVA